MNRNPRQIRKNGNPFIILITGLILIWISSSLIFHPNPIFFPSFKKVLERFVLLVPTQQFWLDLGYSSYRVAFGFLLSIVIAYPIVIGGLQNAFFKRIAFMLVEFFRYLPIPVFIPLTILWFGVDDAGKVFIIFLGTFAQMVPMFDDSARQMEFRFKSYVPALKWSRAQMIRNVIIPGSMPLIWDNCRICFGWAWTYLIIAELLGAENGLGFAIIRAQRYLATDEIFAYVIVIGFIGLSSDRLMVWGKKKLFNWEL